MSAMRRHCRDDARLPLVRASRRRGRVSTAGRSVSVDVWHRYRPGSCRLSNQCGEICCGCCTNITVLNYYFCVCDLANATTFSRSNSCCQCRTNICHFNSSIARLIDNYSCFIYKRYCSINISIDNNDNDNDNNNRRRFTWYNRFRHDCR
jgi:hypothetical protein